MICEKCTKDRATVQVTYLSPLRTGNYCFPCIQEDPFAPKPGKFLTRDALQKLETLGQEIESLRHVIEKHLQAEQ